VSRPRHDQIARVRQGYLAVFMLLLDVILIGLSLGVAYTTKWHPLTQDRFRTTGVLAVLSLLCLFFAAGAVGGFRDMLAGGISRGPKTSHYRDDDFFANKRMIFFYAGVNLTLLTFAVLVEQTGGITASPYIAVFFAFILTGQQLSRFKTQSTVLIAVGAALTLAMWLWQYTHGLLKSPAAPPTLTLVLLVATFIACGLMTNYEKDHNYIVERKEKDLPTQAYVYQDGKKKWHYVIYCRSHRLDPIVDGPESETPETDQALEPVQKRIQEIIISMYPRAEWDQTDFHWTRPKGQYSELFVQFPRDQK